MVCYIYNYNFGSAFYVWTNYYLYVFKSKNIDNIMNSVYI